MTDSKLNEIVEQSSEILSKLNEDDRKQLISELRDCLSGNDVDPNDIIAFLQHQGDFLYKRIEIKDDNIEQELEEKLTKNFINAKGIFISVQGSDKIELNHVYAIADFINLLIPDDTSVIFSSVVDNKNLEGKIKVTIFATGINE